MHLDKNLEQAEIEVFLLVGSEIFGQFKCADTASTLVPIFLIINRKESTSY